ncbi:MAG: ATP-binding protein [Myxococcales bacterium]|jgi:signal transduction histidine kinase
MLRLGLRAQIILALLVVFALSFALLGTATVRLTEAAAEVEQARATRITADVLAAAFAEQGSAEATRATVERIARRSSVRGLRLWRPGAQPVVRGKPGGEGGLTVPVEPGGRLTVWLQRPVSASALPLGELLLFYVGLTGLAVVVLAFFALTHLIVRPLDRITRSSEALSAGSWDVRVPEAGAAEVRRLAASFNAMAGYLRAERLALERRLAELEATTRELRTTQQQLIHGEKLASVGRLAAGVAHEIGNPLAAILGLTELLRSGDLDAGEQSEFLGRIHRETERINGIIRDLLDFSRPDPDDGVPGQSADLQQSVSDAVNLLAPQKESKDVKVEVALDPHVGRVAAPQHRLTQVVLNLLLNAVDALEGEGMVRIESRALEPGRCTLEVADDGPGIDPEMLDHLFEPFTTSKPVGEGTGLGLAVCHALVEAMGGGIRAENRPEGGARFRVELRLADGDSRSATG